MPQSKTTVKDMTRTTGGRFETKRKGRSRPIDRVDLSIISRITRAPLESQTERADHLGMALSTLQHRECREEFKRELIAVHWRGISVAAAVVPKHLLTLMFTALDENVQRQAAEAILRQVNKLRDDAKEAGMPIPTAPAGPQAAVMLNLFGNLGPEQQTALLDTVSADQRRALAELTGTAPTATPTTVTPTTAEPVTPPAPAPPTEPTKAE